MEVTKRVWSKNAQNMKLPWKFWVTFLSFFPCVSVRISGKFMLICSVGKHLGHVIMSQNTNLSCQSKYLWIKICLWVGGHSTATKPTGNRGTHGDWILSFWILQSLTHSHLLHFVKWFHFFETGEKKTHLHLTKHGCEVLASSSPATLNPSS